MSEDEKWGFTDKKGGMPSETKAGMAIVMILICAFGFIAWNKYGTSLKPSQKIVNNGEAGAENGVIETPPPAPGYEVPSAFGADESQVRVAANEEEIFGNQLEPAPVQAAPAGDLWEPETSATAAPVTSQPAAATAQAAPVSPDEFSGFDDIAAAPAATSQPVAPASQPDPVAAFDTSADPFGDTVAAQPQPAAAAPAQSPADPWGEPAAVAAKAAPVATSGEPDPFGVGAAEPVSAAPGQLGQVAMDRDAFDEIGDAFEAAANQQPVQPAQPAYVAPPAAVAISADVDFGDNAFEPQPSPASGNPVSIARSPVRQEPVSVVSQPAPTHQVDPFEHKEAPVDFNEVAPRRGAFETQPVQRYDRGTADTERFVDEPAPRKPVRSGSYAVQSGDTYWSISKKVYGTSRYYRALAQYNDKIIPDPRRMRVGAELAIPTTVALERAYPKLFPRIRNASARTVIDTQQQPGLYVNGSNRPVYRVGANDSLSRIAERHLGRSSRWSQIYELNRKQLASPTSIRPGMLLAMPMDASQVSYR